MDTTNHTSHQDFKVTGDWAAQAKQLKEKYPQLTDADLKFVVGGEKELLKKMETRLNKKEDEVINLIKKVQPVKS